MTGWLDQRHEFTGLKQASLSKFYNSFELFDWTEAIGADCYWMSPELLSLYDTEVWDELDPAQRFALSKWEFINFCSVNMHGEKALVTSVLGHIYSPGFERPTEYFHHFVDEENKHMWMFSKFCLTYGGKIYPNKTVRSQAESDPAVQDFLSFARITIFEEIGDYFNRIMAKDPRLPGNVRKLNDVHHQDESRHLSMGHVLLAALHKRVQQTSGAEEVASLERYLKQYMLTSMESFYNPAVYADAGLGNGYRLRRRLLAHPARKQFHTRVLARVLGLFVKKGIFESESLDLEEKRHADDHASDTRQHPEYAASPDSRE